MKHCNEEDLIDYHYGESGDAQDIAQHLRDCPDCARAYSAIMRDLAEITAPATPPRNADYSEQVWQSIRNSLHAYQPPKKQRFAWLRLHLFGGFAAAAACLLIVAAAAFFAGRQWEHRNPQTPSVAGNASDSQGRERVVLVVLGDHLDRSERLLVELKHAEPSTEVPMQAEARDLLSANRLYRESVKQSGDPVLAAALDHLERVLIEVANEPAGLSQARLDELQKEMNTDGLLFEVRVLRSRVQGGVEQKGIVGTATKGVSI
ncbi:hypothetical protein [Edaphobacter aggregans]|uniref:hypothetical protein n=1 Tax=Edaphobacter aggregans TaxID=570835 RepID=UPI00054D3A5E|nr:hypothetical protein [Edaphobacter aggregans]